jgi:hypothetical protein
VLLAANELTDDEIAPEIEGQPLSNSQVEAAPASLEVRGRLMDSEQ